MPRILILTAGFGEGHNTAARCTREALLALSPDADVRVLDPIDHTSPRLAAIVREFYIGVINHTPKVWKLIYDFADMSDIGQHGNGWLAPSARYVKELLDTFSPDAVVTTYPVYLSFWGEFFANGTCPPCPFHTIVTDSITVNSIWSRGKSSTWCVTDPLTATRVNDLGIAEELIKVTGFPVSPRLATLPRQMDAPSGSSPFRLLYFPIASIDHTNAILKELASLPQSPPWTITVVLGKQKDKLKPMIQAAIAKGKLPASTEIIGWTDQIPELLNQHHAVLGKAGGATVHESRTAARPMLIHYMVPGQEEGNARLLESEGGGHLLAGPSEIPAQWSAWTANGFAGWKAEHAALLSATTADPAFRVAKVILDSIHSQP